MEWRKKGKGRYKRGVAFSYGSVAPQFTTLFVHFGHVHCVAPPLQLPGQYWFRPTTMS